MRRTSMAARLLSSAALILLLAPLLMQTVAAAPRERDWGAIDAQIQKLEAKGANQSAIDALLARKGISRVDDGPESDLVAFASNSNNVTLLAPKVYYDDRWESYVAQARFKWNKTCGLTGDQHCVVQDCVLGVCGGPDGFGLRFSRAFDEVRTSFYTYDDAKQFTWINPETMNAYGASWTEPDNWHIFDHYSWNEGTLYWFFNKVNCPRGTLVKLYSRLEHTWNNTSVTGFGVSLTGFHVNWSEAGSHWSATNASPTNFKC